jgi:hypothetical protein
MGWVREQADSLAHLIKRSRTAAQIWEVVRLINFSRTLNLKMSQKLTLSLKMSRRLSLLAKMSTSPALSTT